MNFNGKEIRTHYDNTSREQFFSAVDILVALTGSDNYNQARKNWNTLKSRNVQLSSNCRQLKLASADGKMYNADVLSKGGVMQLATIVKSPYITELVELLDSYKIKKAQPALKTGCLCTFSVS